MALRLDYSPESLRKLSAISNQQRSAEPKAWGVSLILTLPLWLMATKQAEAAIEPKGVGRCYVSHGMRAELARDLKLIHCKDYRDPARRATELNVDR